MNKRCGLLLVVLLICIPTLVVAAKKGKHKRQGQAKNESPSRAKNEPAFVQAKLSDGSVVTPEALRVPPEELSAFFGRVERDKRLCPFGTNLLEAGIVKATVLTNVPPAQYGRPDGFAFLIKRDGNPPRGIRPFLTPYEQTTQIVRRGILEPELTGILGFRDGKIDGRVHLLDKWPLYYGEWSGGKPSERGLCCVWTSPGECAIVKRGKDDGKDTLVTVVRHGNVAASFKGFDAAKRDKQAKALIESFGDCEGRIKSVGERMAQQLQQDAREVQKQYVAQNSIKSSQKNIKRGNQVRSANTTATAPITGATGVRVRVLLRRVGW